ncbi:AAA family ATPase, partial [Niastella populi]|uniref:AAA family ATPase n=1 Tax=Niastella populi TaxID=550983 RepID=UPI0013FD7269
MLTGIKFKNYKAFQEGHLDIKPITILLGANSVGKSSIIQLFLMLQETALAQNYKSALKLHGGFFSLGEGINLFRKKDNSNTLHFEIKFREASISDTIRKEFLGRYFEQIYNYCFVILTRVSKNEKDKKYFEEKLIPDTIFRRHKEMGFISLFQEGAEIARRELVDLINRAYEIMIKLKDKDIIKEITSSSFIFRSNNVSQTLLNNKDEIILTYDFLKKLQEIKEPEKISLKYDFNYSEGVLKIKRFVLNIGDIEIANVDFDKSFESKSFITSDLVD